MKLDYLNKFSLIGKKVIVAGGNGLLGSEVVKAVMDAGASVSVVDISVSNENSVKSFIFNLSDLPNLKSKIEKIWNELNGFDVWINTSFPRTENWQGEDWENMVNRWVGNTSSHLGGYCLSTLVVADLMKQNKQSGVILNTSSVFGSVGHDYRMYADIPQKPAVPYGAIKGGIDAFTRYAASRYGLDNIRVNSISPGGIENPNLSENIRQKFSLKTPLGRMGLPEEIAATYLFLSSDAATYITGTNIFVDGGWTSI